MRVWLGHRWAVFVLLSLLYFVVSAGTFSSLGVVLPAMVQDLGWNWTEAGLGYTLLGLACGLGAPIPAVLVRRIGLGGALLVGTGLLAGGFATLATTHGVTFYLAGTVLVGIGFALTTTVPATNVLTGLFRRQSTVVGAYFTVGSLGGVAGPLIFVGLGGSVHHWRIYWWCFTAACALIGGIAAATCLRPPATVATSPDRVAEARIDPAGDWTVRQALAAPQFYVIVGAYTMFLLVNTTAHGFAVEHLNERGIAAPVAAGMLSLEALIAALVSVVGGIGGERLRPRTLLIIALAALVIGMAGLATVHGYPLMLVYVLGVGIGVGLSFLTTTMLLLRYFGPGAYLELYSIMCLISTLAALGPAFGGWARDALGSFTGVFILCAVATLAMLVATLLLSPPTRAASRRVTASIATR